MNKKYNYAVFIGRFQPPHKAHIDIINEALTIADRVIVLIGSANQPRTIKNPWTWKERRDMIANSIFSADTVGRVSFQPIHDVYNDNQWVRWVQDAVNEVVVQDGLTTTPSVALIGHKKDGSSYYLDMFPQWQFYGINNIDDMHSTDIRTMMFEEEALDAEKIPASIVYNIEAFMNSESFSVLKREYEFIKAYKEAWSGAPHPPTFITVDVIVVQSGHVLLVRRKAQPGYGLWACCGGFVDQNERLEDAMIRELREETRIKVPAPVLRGNIKARAVYDAPSRSLRGRTITHAYGIELPPGPLPKVKGGDDAEKAKWIPLGVFENMQDQMFEDHWQIVRDMLEKMG